MKAGVATLPCEVINSPALANPSVWSNRKEKLKNHISHKGYTRYAPLSGQWASYVILSESGSRPEELAIPIGVIRGVWYPGTPPGRNNNDPVGIDHVRSIQRVFNFTQQ